ncbi:hypothetical protein H0H92_001468 [Tricholoma furcatifolium]|nr:hypothetical protein H0H92_001468 [Tricholoma furcatifolium]
MALSRTRSKSFKPASLTRRISMPARRMSSHIVSAIHTISPHLHLHHSHHYEEANSYFPEQPADVVEAVKVAEADVVDSHTTKDEASGTPVIVGEAVHEEVVERGKAEQ